MNHNFVVVTSLLVTLVLGATVLGAAEPTHMEVDSAARTKLGLSIYSGGFAVVRDSRDVVLPQGLIELEFTDVAATIVPPTVLLNSGRTNGFIADQQNYRFDLLNRETLLERFVGRKIKYSRSLLEHGNFEQVLREGILLSTNPEIVKFGDVIEVSPLGTISLPYIPDDLKTTPTLVFHGSNKVKGGQGVDVQYHLNGVGWESDYSLSIGKNGAASLTGWITIRNNSGAAFNVDQLNLIAGDVSVASPVPQPEMARMSLSADYNATASRVPNAGDYHVYEFPGKVSLLKNDMTQLRLLAIDDIKTTREYRLSSSIHRYQNAAVTTQPVAVWIQFANTSANNLGRPLPAGTFRVYEDEAQNQFSGEARISHVPSGETVELNIGSAFDITARRVQKSFRKVSERSVEVGIEITVINAKDHSVTLTLDELISEQWTILEESMPGERHSASMQTYNIKVPKQAEVIVSYRVRLDW